MESKIVDGRDNLKCILTDAELLDYARKQAQALSDTKKAEDDLKSFQTAIKNKIAVFEATINDVSEKIRSGYEFRFVDTMVETNYDAGFVRFVRLDTGEIYSQRPLNTEERQFILEFKADTKEGEVK